MALDFPSLQDEPRLLLEAPLRPLQGSRFQPTGFPDLGAAIYTTPSGEELLVESAQSMANRLEAVCWDAAHHDLMPPLQGLSYIAVFHDGQFLTSSILEAHRINSPYILESADRSFFDLLGAELGAMATGTMDVQLLARTLLRYDCNSLLHGVFLTKIAGGRLRLARALSAFIEARGVRVAASGGVKKDDVDPSGRALGTGAADGFGHVPFARDEYTADSITAYFSLDLAQVRAYGVGERAEHLLLALALYKTRRSLREGLRLRTACDLELAGDVRATRPEGFALPALNALEQELPGLIAAVAGQSLFADPPVTNVQFIRGKTKAKPPAEAEATAAEEGE